MSVLRQRASFSALVGLGLLVTHRPASGVELDLRLEAGAAGAIERPQRNLFSAGGSAALRAGISPIGFLDLHLSFTFLGLATTAHDPDPTSGLAWGIGGGIRVKRPRTARSFVHPWLDADATYLRTGALNRAGYDLGVGMGFVVDRRRMVQVGPFLRYLQIIEPSRAGYDSTDAKLFIGGISVEVGTPPRVEATGDRDGDGIPDAVDACPDRAEDRDGFEDQDGCPDLDNDHDGVPDARDACPNQPEDKDGYQDRDGCPDPDNDGDGVPDLFDRCPTKAEDRDGFEDQDGCPDPDNDADGIRDQDDVCPNQAGAKETGGCPDRDGDFTDDSRDQCPDVPGPAENGGCPAYKNVRLTQNKLELSQKIYFARDLTVILPRSYAVLDEVAHVLKDHPALKVRIEGHTDSTGATAHNRALSEGRAQAVRDYLVARKIDIGRLDAHGYGSELPIDSNATVGGRENNRRVEFVILREASK